MEKKFEKISCSLPSLVDASLSAFQDVIVLGGIEEGGQFQIFSYTKTNSWIKIDMISQIIPPLIGHQIVMISQFVGLIFSNINVPFFFNIQSKMVHVPNFSGLNPMERKHFFAVKVEGVIFIYGGDEESFPLLLDISSCRWIVPKFDKNSILKGRLYNSAIAVIKDSIFISGGGVIPGSTNSCLYQLKIENSKELVDCSLDFDSNRFLENQIKHKGKEADQSKTVYLADLFPELTND